jgi:murein L,D-transpeptidase YcbB/YkuD
LAFVSLILSAAAPAALSERDEAAARAALRSAPDEGFARGEFRADVSGDGLRAELLAYASAQRGGRIPLSRFPEEWAIRPAPFDPAPGLAQALASNRLEPWLAGLAPPDGAYRALASAYVRYRRLAADGGWRPLTRPVRLGDAGEAVTALRARLAVEDAAAPSQGDSFDGGLEAAVVRAQQRHGLEPDGVVGKATLAALNVTAAARADQIAANLERWRWMPRERAVPRADLNLADASLVYVTADAQPLSMRIVVGQPKKATPMFEDRIKAVVLNPPWLVPDDIARKEIWPKIRKDPGYAAREGFVVKAGGGLEQLPGPRCALGTIKFDLSNPFGVYLHDTPARTLFAKTNRALSHGCMRLQDPNQLAKRILADNPAWTPYAIDLAILAGKTVRIPLKAPVAVYAAYWTAFVDEDGVTEFRPDIYGWDKAVLDRLAEGGDASR